MKRYLLGLDAGTGSVRALLLDVESGRSTVAVRPWSHVPAPGEGGWAYDFDVEQNWTLLAEAVGEALRRAEAAPAGVAGIAVSSMRHNLVLLREGRAVFAVPNRDARASAEAMEMAGEGEALYRSTGRWPSPVFLLPRLKWLAAHHPGWLEGATALSIGDWVAFRLCGEAATDFSQAGESMGFDLHRREWLWERIEGLGLPPSLFPPVLPSGKCLGKLTSSAAQELGLTPGIPVAVGGADTQCALLALGALRPGQAAIIAGTTAPVQMVVDRPMVDPDRRLWTGLHVLPERWVVESNAGAMGEPLEWLAGLLYPDSPRPAARLMAEAARSRPGAGGLLSTFGAQVFHASAMALPIGSLTLCYYLGEAGGLSRRRDLARSVLEGMACALRANLEQLAALAGEPSAVSLGGGMSRSAFWSQLLADVLGRPIQVSEVPEASALGAAICAGVGAGVFRDLAEGSERVARTRPVAPEEEAGRVYAGVYAGWRELRAAQAASHDLAAGLVLPILAEQGTARAPRPARFHPRMLVTAQLDEGSLSRLRRLGEVEYAPYRETLRVLTGDDLVEALQGKHLLVTEVDVVDLEALERLPELRVVVSCRGQAVNVDLAACTALGIPVLHTPGRNADAVADLTVALMLALLRKLIPADRFLRQPGGEAGDLSRMGQAHEQFLGRELWGKTVGLVGLGAVGRAVARRLSPFGVRLLACDPYLRPEEAEEMDAEAVSLETLLAESDIVSLHAPATGETQGLIGREALSRMKRGALLVNTARAALVDEEALAEALRNGHLAGAALDVFSVEPPAADHPLLALPNVIATPHIGGNTEEVAVHQGRMVVEEVERMLAGERPHHILNPEVLEGFSWEGPRRPVERAVLEALPRRPGPAVSDLQQAGPLPPVEPSVPPPSPGGSGQVELVLRLFCEKARQDAALNAFAARHRVITHYTLTDLGLEFYLGFREGRVVAEVGAPPEPAEVRMKATAETLDGILTGRLSGTRAAMSGKLAFSGDVRVAMGLQRIQGDLVRLYTAAREEAGGIDFSALAGRPPGWPSAPPEVAGDPRPEMVRVIDELYRLGLITATGGNVSVRIPGREECWITPSQLYKGDLRPEMMVRIDLAGNALDAGAPAPSSERALHTELYRARPEVGAIIHAHAPYATILGLSGLPFLPVTTEAAFLGKVPVVPFVMPGTKELALAVVRTMGKSPACILQNHGVVVAAGELRRAANLVEMLERTAQLILGCYAVGRRPAVLPKKVARMLGEMEVL